MWLQYTQLEGVTTRCKASWRQGPCLIYLCVPSNAQHSADSQKYWTNEQAQAKWRNDTLSRWKKVWGAYVEWKFSLSFRDFLKNCHSLKRIWTNSYKTERWLKCNREKVWCMFLKRRVAITLQRGCEVEIRPARTLFWVSRQPLSAFLSSKEGRTV